MERLIPKIVTNLAVAVSKEVSQTGSCTYRATVLKQNDPKAPTIMKSNEEDCLVDVEPGREDEQYMIQRLQKCDYRVKALTLKMKIVQQ